MKVLGKFMGGHYHSNNIAVGGYVAFNVQWINVETYTGKPVDEDSRCLLNLGASYLIARILRNDGEYLDPELANLLIKRLATEGILDLDEYNLGVFDISDVRPDSIYIENAVDEEFNTIPLEVTNV